MVQQMIDSKFNNYGLANTGAGLPTCDKQHLVPVRKTVLRDLQNDNRTVVPKPLENSPFSKKRGPTADIIKVSDSKRSALESLPSPPHNQFPNSNATNGTFVYVRRRSESEPGKSSAIDNNKNIASPEPMLFSHDEQKTTKQQNLKQEPKLSHFSAFAPIPVASLITSPGEPSISLSLGKPCNGISPEDPNYPKVAVGVALPVNIPGTSDQQWKERFLRLQAFLRSGDHSSQEEYTRALRSLSSVGRSRHAVELEKRAIHLFLEEGKEIHRMKVLNVLGKSVPKNNFSPPFQQSPLGELRK